MVAFFEALAATVIGIEACGASHHWARILRSFGHEVKLIAPQFLLVVIPLFFLCESSLDPRVKDFVSTIVRSGAVPSNALPALESRTHGPMERRLAAGSNVPVGCCTIIVVCSAAAPVGKNGGARPEQSHERCSLSRLGMGLAICRSIIEAHGGRLWATPNDPRGAVFQFSVPTRQEEAS